MEISDDATLEIFDPHGDLVLNMGHFQSDAEKGKSLAVLLETMSLLHSTHPANLLSVSSMKIFSFETSLSLDLASSFSAFRRALLSDILSRNMHQISGILKAYDACFTRIHGYVARRAF